MISVRTGFLPLLLALAISRGAAAADGSSATSSNFGEMSMENLMKMTVTTATKREQFLSDTPAAVYVITSEDIARSGMRTISSR